jgi:hypothetical protein
MTFSITNIKKPQDLILGLVSRLYLFGLCLRCYQDIPLRKYTQHLTSHILLHLLRSKVGLL